MSRILLFACIVFVVLFGWLVAADSDDYEHGDFGS